LNEKRGVVWEGGVTKKGRVAVKKKKKEMFPPRGREPLTETFRGGWTKIKTTHPVQEGLKRREGGRCLAMKTREGAFVETKKMVGTKKKERRYWRQ